MDFLESDDRAWRKPTVGTELLQYSSRKVHIIEHACSDTVSDFVWCFSLHVIDSQVENLFCLGSPLAVFLALRGLRPQDDVEEHVLPKSVCKRLLNVYHPADPVVRYYVLVLDLFWSQFQGFMFLYWCRLFRFEGKEDHKEEI